MTELMIRNRLSLEGEEEQRLAFCAQRAGEATREQGVGNEGRHFDYRTAFQRDRDRILHARAFRRLKHKTQVYVPHTGDHPRTRLTHTLEVAQLSRTISRALGLNEDLVEAIALAHDIGHTPFGHSGEKILARILSGEEPSCPLSEEIVAAAGTFKHNYQSVRVVDLLERRYDHPGLNLTDQVREGILKHTTWKVNYPFPLTTAEGLRLALPCHLEGQSVALGDEIAQQTHDLDDGLQAEVVSLDEIERLGAAKAVIEHAGAAYIDERRRWRKAAVLQRGLIHLFVTDAIQTSAKSINRFAAKHGIEDHRDWQRSSEKISATTISFSRRVTDLYDELKAFVYRFIINHQEVNRQDHRAQLVMIGLFRAYYGNPLTLPTYALLRFAEESGREYLRDLPIAQIPREVREHMQADPRFVRIIVDHLAGMSDRYAIEEYEVLYHPNAASVRLDTGRG